MLLFDVQILADDIKKAMVVGDNRIYFSVYPKTFKGFSAILWLREHVAKVLFMDKVMSPNPQCSLVSDLVVGCFSYLGLGFDVKFDAVRHLKYFHSGPERFAVILRWIWPFLERRKGTRTRIRPSSRTSRTYSPQSSSLVECIDRSQATSKRVLPTQPLCFGSTTTTTTSRC